MDTEYFDGRYLSKQAKYVSRIDHLRRTPAKTKFLSLEPLLGPLRNLDLTKIDWAIVGGESGFECTADAPQLGNRHSTTMH